PFSIKWTFEAKDIVTGKQIPVYTNDDSRTDGIQVLMVNESNDSMEIKFPISTPTGIIECIAKANITDPQGNSETVEHHFWSHNIIASENIDEYASLIMSLTGLKDRSKLIAEYPERKEQEFSLTLDEESRRTHIAYSYLK